MIFATDKPDQMTPRNEKWLTDSKRTLQWFIDAMGESEWHRRRRNVTDYFHSIKAKTYSQDEALAQGFEKKLDPLAVYHDWIAWYMYLIESRFDRPACNEPFQWTRVFPVFSVIGRHLDALKMMPGIQDRLKTLLSEKDNKPDTSLYELLVAALYHREGWTVVFIEEDRSKKTPDLLVSKADKQFLVECKRLAKVTDYAEAERQEWQKRARHLVEFMQKLRAPISMRIIFKVPIDETPETILAATFTNYILAGKLKTRETIQTDQLNFSAGLISMERVNQQLRTSPVRPDEPKLIELLTGSFNPQGNYAPLLAVTRMNTIGPEDHLWVLNEFIAELRWVSIAEWDCISQKSIDLKARDLRKTISNAFKQIPEEGAGIIHIGYETVMGPLVEIERNRKIKETIDSFSFDNKRIEAIYCNTMQFLATVPGFECAETTIYFEKDKNSSPLSNNLLFDLPVDSSKNTTHWEEDIAGFLFPKT